jgi:GNAT superfamily N-acetyltransferase
MLLRLEEPSVAFYRYLYDAVGSQWGWDDRSGLDDAALFELLDDPLVEVFVLYQGGAPAGFFELDRRIEGEVELVHFGLVSEFMGRGLGKPLLASAVETAWDEEPDRLWVRYSSNEHPRGLLAYQWAGFRAYDERREGG